MNGQKKQEERRREKLDLIDQQVKEGSLVIRKMTPKERAKYPAKPVASKRRVRR
jgi:signal recognition particle GTPase